jgi:ATP-binding cassette subfamily D (ALD) long-chain fatty acid import protein
MYTALSAQMAGSLRHTHSRLVEFAEEVAFMRGETTEKMLIEREYASLIEHENSVLQRRWWFGCVEEGIIKWLWGSFGVCLFALYLVGTILKVPQLVLCAIPVFFKIPGVGGTDLGGRTEGALSNYSTFLNTNEQFPVFVTNRRLLLSSSGRDTSAIQP